MAKEKQTASAAIKEQILNQSDKSNAEIASLVNKKHGLSVTGNFVSAVRSDLRKAGELPSAPEKPTQAKKPASKKKSPTKKKPVTSAPPAPAAKVTSASKTASVSKSVADLKAAAESLGKDEAKAIIDLL